MSGELMTRDIDGQTWEVMKSQATTLVKSGFLPKAVDTPEKALAIAMKGRELGLPMMQSITSIHVIDCKPTISAELMAALVHQRVPGSVLRCIETSDKICTYEAARPSDKILKMSFTWDEAVRAGVTNKDNWKKYPAAMLRARCCSAICRIVFPDAIMGCYTPDELGAITNDEGEVVDVIDISSNQRKSDTVKSKSTTEQPKGNGQTEKNSVPVSETKAKLKEELLTYCNGNVQKAEEVLKNISYFEAPDRNDSSKTVVNWVRSVDGIDKISDKWAGTVLGALRKLVAKQPIPQTIGVQEGKQIEGCTQQPLTCDHSSFFGDNTVCVAQGKKECPYSLMLKDNVEAM